MPKTSATGTVGVTVPPPVPTITSRRLWLSDDDLAALTNSNNPNSNNNSRHLPPHKNNRATITTTTTTTSTSTTQANIFEQFASRPTPRSFVIFAANSLVFFQEFVLTCYMLAGHRAVTRWQKADDEAVVAAMQYQETTTKHRHNDNHEENGALHDNVDDIDHRLKLSLGLVWLALCISMFQTRLATQSHYKVEHRMIDFLWMGLCLRFLAAVLKTLTASYSSDTVYALAVASLVLHLFTCDYDYASGMMLHNSHDADGGDIDAIDDSHPVDDGTRNTASHSNQCRRPKRPKFKGGTTSLTSAFFATTLLSSRLESTLSVYLFVCSSVVLFALFPAARHLVAVKAKAATTRLQHKQTTTVTTTTTTVRIGFAPTVMTAILTAALIVLLDFQETILVTFAALTITIIVPFWKYQLQYFKVTLRGPWDLPVLTLPTDN
jgi:phosphatidylinositol glycan class C protein